MYTFYSNIFTSNYTMNCTIELIYFYMFRYIIYKVVGDKPLSEPNDAYSTDAYMRHSASVSLSNVQQIS